MGIFYHELHEKHELLLWITLILPVAYHSYFKPDLSAGQKAGIYYYAYYQLIHGGGGYGCGSMEQIMKNI
jgi:hypothetical protein